LAILSFVVAMLCLNKAFKWFTGFGIYILLAIASFPVAMLCLIKRYNDSNVLVSI
jgi:hypothetical protein